MVAIARYNRLTIEGDISGDEQQSDFQNATLQGDEEHDFDFSIATYLDVPEEVALLGWEAVGKWLHHLLYTIALNHEEISFDVQIGPWGAGKEDE